MIQRIQSIYLFVAALLSGVLTAFLSIWSSNNVDVFMIDLLKSETTLEKVIPALFVISTLLSFVTIFLFKNRKLQFVLGRVNILTNLFLLGLLIYLSLTLPGEANAFKKGIGMFLPVLVILLVALANKAIKKDEDLVKSADRLR